MGDGQGAVGDYPAESSTRLRKAAFFKPGSATFSIRGTDKLRALVNGLPKNARNVVVVVVGVSVSRPTVAENIDMARDRAKTVADYLLSRKVPGTYKISISTSFDIGADGRPNRPKKPGQATVSRVGKPLTTARITYDLAD